MRCCSGHGTPATSTIPPWSPLYPEGSSRCRTTPSRPRVARVGRLGDRNGDGIRENARGRPLRFTLMTSDAPLNRAVVEVVQSPAQAGRRGAQVAYLEFQTMLAQHKARDFDAVFTSWVMDNFQVASTPVALFHSKLGGRAAARPTAVRTRTRARTG